MFVEYIEEMQSTEGKRRRFLCEIHGSREEGEDESVWADEVEENRR